MSTKFEVEILKINFTFNLYLLKFKKNEGTSGDYKEACKRVVTGIKF
jgi:hypothetical protein